MGMIDTMALSSALWNGVIPGPAMALWAWTVLVLAVSSCGIWLARTRRPARSVAPLRMLYAAGAH